MPATVIRKLNSEERCRILLEDRKSVNLTAGTEFYKIDTDDPIDLGIGVFSHGIADSRFNKDMPDLDGDGSKESFSHCSTSEGILFSVWKGKAYDSPLIWSGYYYLGYDMDPNCPPIPNN